MRFRIILYRGIWTVSLVIFIFSLTSCDFLFGTRKDSTIDEIFDQGKIDPNLVVQNLGYVPILPVWKNVSHPIDVFVGYDEMVYVVDDEGVKVFDLKGQLHRLIKIPGAKEITQDRRIHTYVIGTATINIGGQDRILSAVYHLTETATATGPKFIDTLIHPFCDESRRNYPFRNEDLSVEFTGLGCRADNMLYVSRKGTVNDLTQPFRPDNTILFFDENGVNTGYSNGLNPVKPNLRSALGISALAVFCGPPQKLYGVSETHDFMICQADQSQPIDIRVLWIKEYLDPENGAQYIENQDLLMMDPEKADNFLYKPNRFSNPEDICIAPDQSGYVFVVDSKTDSFYIFTLKGYEGIKPPVNSTYTKNVMVSFGGKGAGVFQFDQPCGVAYYKKTVFIADKNNNRILRYRLNTDLE